MENLSLYNAVRNVPKEAQKTINAGRLKGMTDINPMWRIKTLTEQFGMCGIGWKTQIVRTWIDNGAEGEIIANIEILLFVKVDGQWSEGIPGIGGSRFVTEEKNGLYTDDECYKKAYTDALSVACKALGIGADVYFCSDRDKYSTSQPTAKSPTKQEPTAQAKDQEKPPAAATFQKLTKTEIVTKYGVKNVEATIAWFEERFGIPFNEWDEDATTVARSKLEDQKKKREAAEQNKNDEYPFPMK